MKSALLTAGLLALGGAALAFALAGDALGLGRSGLGWRQLAAALGGAGMLVLGLRRTRAGRDWLAQLWPATPELEPLGCLVLCAWLGAVTGLGELVHQAIRKWGFGVVLRQPEHVLWMAPLCYAVAFTGLGAALLLGGAVLRRRPSAGATVLAGSLLGIWSQLLIHPWLDGGAALVLTAGLALQLTRWLAVHTASLVALSRRTLPWLGLALCAGGLAVPMVREASERNALAVLPAARSGAPNLILIVLDTVRADHLGVYGYRRDTAPRIANLARSGVVFDQAMATAPWTLPSHVTLFTGLYHHQHDADWLVPLGETAPTLAEVLAARGYATGGFAGNLSYCSREQGIARGFSHYEDFRIGLPVLLFSTALGRYAAVSNPLDHWDRWVRNDAEDLTDSMLRWIDHSRDRPFFAFVNYFDAHARYRPPPDLAHRFDPNGPPAAAPRGLHWTPAQMQRFRDAYDACILGIDRQIGRLIEGLSARHLLDDTAIAIVGDHGEQFGEHDLMGHANSLYPQLLHVPLVVVPPGGLPAPVRVTTPVSLRDVPATLLALAGATASPLPGHSLVPVWRGSNAAAARSPVLSELTQGINSPPSMPNAAGGMASLLWKGLLYVRNGDGSEELYRASDGAARHDLADSPDHRHDLERIRAELAKVLGS